MSNNKNIGTRRQTIERRNKDIKSRYDTLYNKNRIRHDDCIDKLAFEFYLSAAVISRIIQSSV